MENNTEMLAILERMEKVNRKQLLYTRLQCLFAVIAAVCCLAVLLTVVKFVPQLEALTVQMSDILHNIDTVTKELASVDLGQMVQNVDSLVGDVGSLITEVSGLVTDSQGAVSEALEKLNALDLEKLNKAIEDFAAIIEPLAKAVKWLR